MGEDGGDEGKEREGSGLEGGHDWEGDGKEGADLVGQEKNQKQKILIIYLYYNFFGKHTIGYFPWA